MAKETTDVFNVNIEFANAEDKLQHMLRVFNKAMTVDQLESDDLEDTFKIKLSFKDVKEKWRDLFTQGEWINSYVITSHKSTPLGDDFVVEAKYKGGAKAFEKSFHRQGYGKRFELTTSLVSTKTVNLGVLSPYGKTISKSQKEVLGILKTYFVDVLRKAGFTKKSKIPEATDKMDFAASVIGGGMYHSKWDSRLLCIHLAGWKIGILPKEGDEERFMVFVSRPGRTYHRNKSPTYDLVLTDLGIKDRVVEKQDPVRRWSKIRQYKELFLGDPDIDKVMTAFFRTISKTPLPPAV